jgi:uncharacterized membrane protein YjfL (UPF0719 family)
VSVKEFIRKGFSLDIFFLFFLGCFVAFFRGKKIFSIVNVTLGVYFCDERMGLLVDFFSISAGIYITMLSILAISTTKIMEALLRKRMEQQLLDVMMWGLISNVIAILGLVFIPEIQGKNIILLAILIWAILHLIYFLLVLFAIFKFNVQNMDKEIDEENKWKNEIVKKIAIIQSDMQEIVKEIKKSK